jgi:ATP-dependent DNA helicase RecG
MWSTGQSARAPGSVLSEGRVSHSPVKPGICPRLHPLLPFSRMDLAELLARIDSWENPHTKSKVRPVHPDDLAALVAFANTDGGDLILGALLRLFQAAESLYYDETPLLRLSLQDLDLAAFESYLEETGQSYLLGDDPQRLLANWYLTANGHPTLAGILLFGRKPQQHLPYAQINAARFPGTDSSFDPVDRKDLGGRLLEVIDQAERFLDLHLPVPHEIHGFEPEPKPELPKEALREAVVNAVAHRDYTIRGPIRLFIFDDRIEIHTPGRPPNGVDTEAMRSGAHVVRNPWIYARLSDAGLVTRAGTGIRRIVRLVREATGREVGIEVRDFEVLLTLPRKLPPGCGPGT